MTGGRMPAYKPPHEGRCRTNERRPLSGISELIRGPLTFRVEAESSSTEYPAKAAPMVDRHQQLWPSAGKSVASGSTEAGGPAPPGRKRRGRTAGKAPPPLRAKSREEGGPFPLPTSLGTPPRAP